MKTVSNEASLGGYMHTTPSLEHRRRSSATVERLRMDEKSSSMELEDRLPLPSDGLLKDDQNLDELESQLSTTLDSPPAPVEYSISTRRKLVYLGLYFFLNLGLTLSNKAVMQHLKLPWLLTVMHTSATSIGCTALLMTGHLKLSRLATKENLILLAFSSLFTLNIAISNVSLALVSVPFHQVLRSTCPIATILIYKFVYGREYERQTWLTMIPLILGVGLATFGDYYFTLVGFALTLLGVVLAATKTVASNRLMTGTLKLSALEILFRMSPLAAIQCLFYAAISGELTGLQTAMAEGKFSALMIFGLLGNATVAFFLNIVSFQTNKVAGALTISVCGNLKQCLTILLGIVLFSVKVTPVNGVGMLITVGGAAWYSKSELDVKNKKSVPPAPSGSSR
ncbi:gdp-mannose transporter gonst5 [Acrodontium crateriforme]|uniref:Gdp-mannose transporter gonst5 n=1 Tax=Acrodontium crateriforme TaxID=150365 RepID=A0AAQ3M139_9PEZI|nr:gdp-mannose transporter gonst5 [Acrodontium crateriforme]